MTKSELAAQAAMEACSPDHTARLSGEGHPFWNAEASQFLYIPSFQFQGVHGCYSYRYTAIDETGKEHTFTAREPSVSLSPIWGELPGGVVQLRVDALDESGAVRFPVGARTFFKLNPFPADLPPAACSYRECAVRAYDFAFNMPSTQYWLEHGVPDPDYNLNVYPSKIYGAVIGGMLRYAKLRPERAEAAMKIARNAADYLLRISEAADAPLAFLPPTYYIDFREHPETRENLTAADRLGTMMMIYPAFVGSAYLQMEEATGEKKYFDSALRIAEFYKNHVLDSGSWSVILSRETGEAVSRNLCMPLMDIVPFLMAMFRRTGDTAWKDLADGAVAYVEREVLPRFDWEGQFEDSRISANYSNLSHYGAGAFVQHYAAYYADDEARMRIADDVMRFVEDQFVVWNRPSPWVYPGYPTEKWTTPAGLEQYKWYMPIDASTSAIMLNFLSMYDAGRGELHLAKARALADVLTRVQKENGQIPTHWMNESEEGAGFWINCHLSSAAALFTLDSYLREHGIEE